MNDPIFPGQTSLTIANVDGGSSTYSLGNAEFFKQEAQKNINNANSIADQIADIVGDMESNAANLAGLAELAIENALQFTASLNPVTYNIPSFAQTERSKAAFGNAPNVGDAPQPPEVAGYNVVTAQDGYQSAPAVSAPSLITISIPDAPPMSASISPPQAPGDVVIADKPPPVVSYTLKEAAALQPIHDAPVIDIQLNFQSFDAAKFDPVQTGELDRAIANIGAAKFTEMPQYDNLLPELMTYVGTLLSGKIVGDAKEYEPFATHVRGTDIWSKRGINVPDFSAYADNLTEKMAARAGDKNKAFAADARAEAILIGYDIGLAAYGVLLEIESARISAEFDKSMAEAKAHLEKIKASEAVYNAMVAIYQAAVAEYNAELIKLAADVDKFKAEIGIESMMARINAAKADAFAATERAKGLVVREFLAKVGEQESRLSLYAAQLGQFDAVLAKQDAEIAKYLGRITEWEAALAEAESSYKTYSANVKAYVARLKAGEAHQQIQQVEHGVVAALAKQQAVQVDMLANKMVADARVRATSYDVTDAQNAMKGIEYQIKEAQYSASALDWGRANAENIMEWRGIAADARAKIQFAQQVMQSAGRAAQLTQSGNIQLANAYAAINEAAGRAGAALQQGKMSGFRTSVALSAAGSISGSLGWGYSDSQSTNADAQYIERVETGV